MTDMKAAAAIDYTHALRAGQSMIILQRGARPFKTAQIWAITVYFSLATQAI